MKDTKMKTLMATIFIAMVGFTTAAHASPLSDCYDLVIDSCNQGNHPVPCANSGFDECDKVYKSTVGNLGFVAKSTRKRAERTFKRTQLKLKSN